MFKLPKEVIQSAEDFNNALKDFREGSMSPDRFKGVRVPWGIYSQRGGSRFMARMRIPAGAVTPKQLEALADCSQTYGNGVLHITTRQDIQIHDVNIEDTEQIIEHLKEFDLSPRGGGGNTVRNITACPFAGICSKEAFDVRSYAISLTEFLLSDPDSYRLPRKYKIAFSGCGEDCALATLNDLGFIAKETVAEVAETSDRKKREGFSVYAGGGMGARSRVGQLLEEFIPPKDVGYVAEAVKRVFFKHGERKNRHRARLRFLVEKIGFDEFKNLYKSELEELKDTTHIALRKVDFKYLEDIDVELPISPDRDLFETFKAYNVLPQKQKGYFIVGLRLNLGDIQAEKLGSLAQIVNKKEGERGREGKAPAAPNLSAELESETIEFRAAQSQNIYICNVKADTVYTLYEKLKELDLASPYVSTVFDPVSCQGASTCNLGICDSKALAHELIEFLEKDGLNAESLDGFNIRMSGCPNSCGHHPRDVIGLHGLVRKVGVRPVPFYKILLGGRVKEGETKLAQEVGIVPARNVPHVLKKFLKASSEKVGEYDNVYDYLQKEGKLLMEQLIEEHAYVPPYEEDATFYQDFGKDEDFTLAGIGKGECGAGVLDLIDTDLEDAQRKLILAEEQNYDVQILSEVLHLSVRALLVVRGIEPRSSEEAADSFKKEFVHTNIAAEKFKDLKEKFLDLKDVTRDEEKKELFTYAKEFHQEVQEVYCSMDSSFNFPQKGASEEEKEEREVTPEVLDLKGTACPINYVKAKLFIEKLEPGSILDIYLDEGEPINNVPKSLENDGHKILDIQKIEGFYRVRVEKSK
ncbi:sulfurtransferase TusA family protein [bacterium]|nr:sulfurtransferase TusA family protein [bacterium]